jgi:hypothetical protein
MIYSATLFVLVFLSVIVHDLIPTLSMASEARLLIVPAVFFCASVTVSYPVMLALALFTGFLWDARYGLITDIEGGTDLQLGISVLLYGLLGSLMQGVRPLFRRGKWGLPVLMSGFLILFMLVFEFLLINFKRGHFSFPPEIVVKIVVSALLSVSIAPLLMYMLHRLASRLGYRIRYEGIRFRTLS